MNFIRPTASAERKNHYLCAMNHRELIAALTPLHGEGEARAIVRMVMEERFGLSQTDLLLGKGTTLSADDRKDFEKIAHRLCSGEPVQYVLGYTEFFGHRFRVTPDVLIPRPETEELVQYAIDELCAPVSKLFDLCTGSGCIAISLALAFPSAYVRGIDISESALAIARENAAALGASNVEFVQQDLLSPLSFAAGEGADSQSIDLVISNPPYVRSSEAGEIAETVLKHEPHLALFVPDADPLRFYRAIAAVALRLLRTGGLVLAEINSALAVETCRLFVDAGFLDVSVRDDQYGRPRMLKARHP